jgi:hypothetical protein
VSKSGEQVARLLAYCSTGERLSELSAAHFPGDAKELVGGTIPDKPRSRLERYQTTPLGKVILGGERFYRE